MGAVYSLSKAARLLGVNRQLITFLVQDRQIPVRVVGKAKAIDSASLARLRAELVAYKSKRVPMPGRKRKRKATATP